MHLLEDGRRRARTGRRPPGPVLLAAVLALTCAAVPPSSPDLAAQVARGALFDRAGLLPYWAGWYGGVDTLGYSLLSPPLLGVLSPVVCGALALVATGLLAVPLLSGTRRPRAGAAALVGTAWLDVLAGRTTFALGMVALLGALLAVSRDHRRTAALLGAVTTATSPVAGVLLLVPAVALVLADRSRRTAASACCCGAAAAVGVLALLVPSHGVEPFARAVFLPALAVVVAPALLPVGRLVRTGCLLAAAATTLAYVLPTAMGSNVTRLALLGVVPAVAATVRAPRAVAALLVVALSWWPVQQVRIDLRTARSPAAQEAYTAGLRARVGGDPLTLASRLEVVPSAAHWPEARLLPVAALARGWERQTDEQRNPLFYGRAPLTPASYRAWLDRWGVALVAVPRRVRLDFGGTAEAALVAAGLPYLREVWQDPSWHLYEVERPAPVLASGRVLRFTDGGVDVEVPRAGRFVLRLAWSRFLHVSGGRVSRAPGGQVLLELRTAGVHRVRGRWLP